MKSNRVLRLLSAWLLLAAALISTPTPQALAADPVVKIVPATSTIQVGETVVVSVTVENVSNLFGAEFHLSFDASTLEVVDADAGTEGVQISMGDFLAPDFVAQNLADNATGTIDFAISQMAPHGAVSGSGTLATITFKGKAAGTASVSFTNVLLADAGGGQIPSSSQNATVTVTSGATATPAPTTPAPTTPAPTASPTAPPASSCTIQGYHTVRAGETLYSIGRAYATDPNAIAACNGIVNPSLIYVGTQLGIPVAPWSPIPPGPVAVRQFTPDGSTPAPSPSTGCRYYHTVQWGDTLTAIAVRYGSDIWSIGLANSISNLNLIYTGQVLCIP